MTSLLPFEHMGLNILFVAFLCWIPVLLAIKTKSNLYLIPIPFLFFVFIDSLEFGTLTENKIVAEYDITGVKWAHPDPYSQPHKWRVETNVGNFYVDDEPFRPGEKAYKVEFYDPNGEKRRLYLCPESTLKNCIRLSSATSNMF